MHEFELGVLKSVLKHLIRILYTLDPGLVTVLNERQVPLASSVTIRLIVLRFLLISLSYRGAHLIVSVYLI